MKMIKQYIKYKDLKAAKEILGFIKSMCYTVARKQGYVYDEDILSKSVEDVFSQIDVYDEERGSFFNWVYAIIKNNYLLKLRYNKKFVQEYTHTIYENEFYDLKYAETPEYEYFELDRKITIDEIQNAVIEFVEIFPKYNFFIETIKPGFNANVLIEKYGCTIGNYKNRLRNARGYFHIFLKYKYPNKIIPELTWGNKGIKYINAVKKFEKKKNLL